MDLIVSPAIVALNTHSGAPKPAMTPGQLIDALVLQLIDATTVRLAIADSVVDVKTEVPLQPGMHVRLAVRGHGEETRWVIVGSGASLPSAQPRGPATTQPTVPSPHAALPATKITIGANTLTPDADAAVASHVRPDQIPNATRPPPPPTPAATPAAEFARATRSAAARQSGLAPVFAELNALVLRPDVPPAVRQASNQVLATPVQLDGASGETLRQAISKSGLFLETRLAADGRAAVPVIGDLKSALLTLRQALGDWLESVPLADQALKPEAASARASLQAETKPPPPPYRGAPTGGQQPLPAAPLAETPLPELARALMTHTDGAIARQVLMQVASLPDASSVAVVPGDVADTHWNLEIPFATPQGAAIAHFEIARDSHKGSSRTPAGAAWRANFSLDFEPMGPVHAQIALTGKRAAVRIWAERKDTAAMLRAGTSDLSLALRAASLDAGEVIVRDGAPPRPLKPNPGRFLDRAS